MKPQPLLNAGVAVAHIFGIALLFRFLEATLRDVPDTILNPIGALSLLVFSVALMGFLFFYHPLVMVCDGKRDEAVHFFLKTLGAFGIMVTLLLVALFLV